MTSHLNDAVRNWPHRTTDYILVQASDIEGHGLGSIPGSSTVAKWVSRAADFFELHRANKSELAVEALARIGAIYAVEASAREKHFDAPARHALRKTVSRPLVESLFIWLKATRPKVNNGSAAAKAVDYLLRNEPAFTAYLDDGCFPIDNNPFENAIRPIALGRKNWLFAGSLQAGQRAANIMSLVHSAKANGHEPMAYLADILERIPVTPPEQVAGLLPHVWKPPQA